ncbi:hypothetical protein [Sphingomonas sanxanigenens]|uniref:Abortive infection protein-like C-terminal domain-containing protein n=1 Tax=Sphingomonas sanxanigenens DSM 19645 = NX02 TaxID=1123269 RepID=W0ALW4_9SPHN|nr:hypothetical protein [Sphingomonas sanxanigenens]AHE57333.1 hypothetical protein NX02_28790 [Sphingomonas sanxanigenens DSM 19645 = NX02]
MSEPDFFSGRLGLRPLAIVHNDAPIGFRHAVVGALKTEIISSEKIIGVVQRGTALPRPPGHVTNTVLMAMIEQCEWWRVFDVAEAGYTAIHAEQYFGPNKALTYERAINEACRANSLGWKLESGIFAVISSTAQHDDAARIIRDLDSAQLRTSASELREAHRDLSRRPLPDISGGMQHAGAAIECLAREISGDTKLTLGDIIKKHDDLFPGAYRKMADGMWGIVSNQGRHIKEEGEPTLEEALFVVGSITNLAAYLLARRPPAR